jgi:ammonia channel protein AmtB
MGLRRWVRARRITTPPEVVPLIVIGVVAIWVAWAVFDALNGILGAVEVIVGVAEEDVSLLASIAGAVLATLAAVLGSYLLRRLVAGWVRRQPPDPPRAGPMDG